MDNALSNQRTSNDPAGAKFGWVRLTLDLALLWSFISAISIPLRIDNWPPAVFLSYPPRAPYILLAVGFAIYLLITRFLLRQIQRGYWIRLGMSLAVIICCIYSLGWNPLRTLPVIASDTLRSSISLVTANTGEHSVEFVDQLAKTNLPAVICLQEIPVRHHEAIATRFPSHQLFYSKDDTNLDHDGDLVFTNVTCLDRSTFDTEQAVVDANVTGYRTFAVVAPLRSNPSESLAIVNVHTTKALVFHAGLQGFIFETPRKSQRHVDERIAIEAWANKQPSKLGILLAGDFNAPPHTVGARFQQFTNSHLVTTNSSLLTFPESWPVLGIDHVFGNARVHFTKSEVLRNPFSDHRYRRVEFSSSDL